MPKAIIKADVWKYSGTTVLSSTDAQKLGGADKDLPDGAICLLEMILVLSSPEGNTANEPVVAEAYLESDDFKVNPFHVLAQPIGSSLLKPISQVQGDLRLVRYPENARLGEGGGGKIKCYGKGLFNHTIEPYMGIALRIANYMKNPQYYGKIGTFTNTGTAVGEAKGSGIEINGGKRLRELSSIVVGTTVAALKGLIGHFRITSDGFTPSWEIEMPINCASGVVDTDIHEAIAGVLRLPQNLGMSSKLTIRDNFNLAVALTTTGNFVVGALYN